MTKCDITAPCPLLRYSYAAFRSRPMEEINLTGKPAEQFDNQMDVDRAFAEASDDCVFFRPEMNGEWDTLIQMGSAPARLWMFDAETDEALPGPYNWTCVVDILRATGAATESSGCRTRLQCANPCTPERRAQMRQMAIDYVCRMIDALKKQNKPKGFGK